MKAILFEKYGSPDVLQLKETEKPLPADDQVLVKVLAASVNALDWHLMRATPILVRLTGSGFFKPKDGRIGADLAGRVEAVGKNVTRFHPGDEVFGTGAGTFAEYACTREIRLAPKPAGTTFEAAAAVPVAGITALQSLRDKGKLQSGQKVLVNGAGGGVGTFAVQIAKALGAEVTAVCGTHNLDTVRSIGADRVIDYTGEDVTRNGQRYDLILAVNGYHPVSAYRRLLNPEGNFVMVGSSNSRLMQTMIQTMILGSLASRSGGQKISLINAEINSKDLAFLKELLEAGKITPVIDRTYPLSEAPEALRHMEAGHLRGKIVITVA